MGEIIEFNKKEERITLNEENKIIDEIHNYYLNNSNIIGYELLDEKVFDNIDSIVVLKGFNNISKNKYIQIIKLIKKLKRNIIDEIILVSNLTEIFLYLDENLCYYDVENLMKIVLNKKVNEIGIEKIISIFDDSDPNRKKM